MSFSGEVKEELAVRTGSGRHCMIAELTAIITMCGGIRISEGDRCTMHFHTENRFVARKCSLILREAFQVRPETGVRLSPRRAKTGEKGKAGFGCSYCVAVPDHEDTIKILKGCCLIRHSDGISALTDIGEELPVSENSVLKRVCCRRAFFRGAFLSSGSISDPKKSNHFEIVCASMEKARQLQEIADEFSLDARIVQRKQSYVLYLKEGSQIVDALGIMEAPRSLMELENIRILREISNDVNRRVNCETANIGKTVTAAQRQIRDIEFIETHGGLSQLPPPLRMAAMLRLRYQDISLAELGQMFDPPLGKSGVNHRIEKISMIAQQLRGPETSDNVR